ncbi:MAG: hypothetical protein KAS72_10605 [Phycisphaerales bacterium]|nr:hypothetical protein [Phycisphaerales bacterium]
MLRFHALLTTFALLASPAFAGPPCNADLTGDGYVGQEDLGVLLAAYELNADGDLDGDNDTDQADLGILLAEYGQTVVFDFGTQYDDAEAWQIGLEMLGPGGSLLLPATSYERIDRDLDLIRVAEPDLADQTHTMAWAANQLMVSIVEGADDQEYRCLNEYYQVTDEEHLFGTWYLLTFAGKLNVEALAVIYVALPEIQYAEPNGLMGGENFWTPSPLGDGIWRWEIDDGFMDCFDGCDCHRYYVFETDEDGTVTLISYEEVGYSWCDWGE